eukprot:CAMPEP_0172504338 /NCGR_PEP_ID=MMETSP1066-20121228/177756_1 /TAXON_ID=671091 /ORGANISM="Coscinodiscus wailesii, Strain CCMP2513" /LENGTH=314 /DNA_ID=CAMNT_0013280487 /DNA_START=62 /DNA_END=1006 /DNA_ORIENTATION=+
MSTDAFMDLLSAPYKDNDERKKCQTMIENLTNEEKEEAAHSSYAYYTLSTTPPATNCPQARDEAAMKMARRHLVAEKDNMDKALEAMKETITFRKERQINDIRSAFQDISDTPNDRTSKIRSHYRAEIESELSKQAQVVYGYDKQGSAIIIKFPRYDSNTDIDSFIDTHIYIAERAIACTESKTNGGLETICVVLDYADYSRGNLPPVKMVIHLVGVLQKHYPERLAYCALVGAPVMLRGLWRILKPFVDVDTRKKVKFVNTQEQKQEILGPLISEDEAMPFMLPGGKLESSVDVKQFLYEILFHQSYQHSATK